MRTETDKPQAERLLAGAHGALAVLRERREVLLRSGIDISHLPAEWLLMAFALLGDHDRNAVMSELRESWTGLQNSGFAHGTIENTPTAELRLLAHVREHAEAIGPILDQLRDAENAPTPPSEIWHCAGEVEGPLWTPVRLHFSVLGSVRHLLIEPDPIFHLQPAILAIDPDERKSGSIVFPMDAGALRITLATRNGGIFRQVVQARVTAS